MIQMGLHKKTIKEIMMRAAKFQISEAAIYRMISVSEKFIEEKTRQAEKLLE